MSKLKLISRLTEFVQHSHSKKITHGHVGVWDKYPCANPGGPVDNSDCDDGDSLCNCPCQELKPNSEEEVERINTEQLPDNISSLGGVFDAIVGFVSGELEQPITSEDLIEPTDEEIEAVEQSIKECGAIETYLGEEWLGCLWNDMDHPSSCNCPCVGKRFGEYLDYTRTYSTYWDTDPQQQLWRNAQMQLVTSQKAMMQIHGDLTLRPGTLIYIKDEIGGGEESGKKKISRRKISGRWMVASIVHSIGAFPVAHLMSVILIRDTQVNDPNEEPGLFESVWDAIKELMGG